jgi:hypothetical protein
MNLFIELAVIDFESENIKYDDLYLMFFKNHSQDYMRKQMREVYERSLLYKVWRSLNNFSPSLRNFDRLLSRGFSGHINIGSNITIFGYNAMMWAITWKGEKGYWLFRPPCFLIMGGRGFTLGRLYCSPTGQRSNPKTVHYYGKNSIF